MGTEVSDSRREKSEERRWGDSPSRESAERDFDDAEEYDKEKTRDRHEHRSKDKKKSRREDKDHRSRDRERSKTDGEQERQRDVKNSGKERISSKEKKKEGKEEHGKDGEKDKVREKDYDKDKPRGKDHDTDKKNQDRKRDRHKDRGNEPESNRGWEKDREKEKGKEKEVGKDKGKDRDRGKHRESGKEKEKTREDERDHDKNRNREIVDKERETDYSRERERMADHGKKRSTDKDRSSRNRDDHDFRKDGAKDGKVRGDNDYNRDRDIPYQGKSSHEDDDAVPIKQGDYVDDSSAAQDKSQNDIEKRILKMKEERLKRKSEGASEILSWVNKSRELEDTISFEKRKAKQRSKVFDEQDYLDDDDDFEWSTKNKGEREALAGVKVLHGFEKVLEGGSVVLTLKDQEILADGDLNENMDMLENVEIGEQKRRNEAYKAGKKTAGIYDDKFSDQLGEEKKLLPQYDDPAEEEGVTLDVAGRFTADGNKKLEELRRKLRIPSHNNKKVAT